MSERNEIHELALKFIESEEMREYWGDTLLSGNTRFEGLISILPGIAEHL